MDPQLRRAPGVRFVEADLFAWEPDRRYDGVFFGSSPVAASCCRR